MARQALTVPAAMAVPEVCPVWVVTAVRVRPRMRPGRGAARHRMVVLAVPVAIRAPRVLVVPVAPGRLRVTRAQAALRPPRAAVVVLVVRGMTLLLM